MLRRIVLGPEKARPDPGAALERQIRETLAAADRLPAEYDARALEWPLTGESVVLDIGCYQGRWALQIARRYNPRLYCFDPQVWACDVARRVLADYHAEVFAYGLGERQAALALSRYGSDGASFLGDGSDPAAGELREIGKVLRELAIQDVDLALVNVEGYEYVLVPHMLRKKILPRFLMIQCHGLGAPNGYDALRAALAEYYTVKWDYGYTLAAFERLSSPEANPFTEGEST